MMEFRWGSDKTIDLKLILDSCFQIHNKSGKRYKLLTHNCYFFAQTIIMIAVRKTAACRAELDKELDKALKRGITWDVTGGAVALEALETLGRELGQELGWVLGRAFGQVLGRELGRKLGQELGRRRVLGRDLGQELGQELGGALGWALGWELGWVLGPELGWVLGPELGLELGEELVQGRLQLHWQHQHQQQQQDRQHQRRRQHRRQQPGFEQDVKQVQIGCWNWWWGKQQQKRLQVEQEEQEERQQLWKHLREHLRTLEPAWEPALALTRTLAQGALVEVLELALKGELEPGRHATCGELDTFAAKTGTNKLIVTWYVKQQFVWVMLLSCLIYLFKGEVADWKPWEACDG
jgi:hypothetical protein